MMATLSQYEQGWRAGFYGREPASADTAYMEGWAVGLRRGDRTRERNPSEIPNSSIGPVKPAEEPPT